MKAYKPNSQFSKLPISAFIIALNEENNLKQCLESISFCQEIILVDSGSLDRTREIAKQYGAIVYNNEFKDYRQQKQFALERCSQNWVLSIDADERVSQELYEFIANLDLKNTETNGYEFRRLHRFLGKWIKYSGLYPDYKLRLFRRQKGSFKGGTVHERVEVEGKVQKVQHDLLHYSWNGIKDFFDKQIKYAHQSAKDKYLRGAKVNFGDIFFKPTFTFFHRFFLRLGFLDGWAGLVIASGWSIATTYKYLHLWELKKENSINSPFERSDLVNAFLKPIQVIYALALRARNFAYDRGLLKKNHLSVPVISIGNLSVGGSGKTPFTIWLSKALCYFIPHEITILTRGYNSKVKKDEIKLVNSYSEAAEIGDEPLLMHQNIGDMVKVLVCPNRFQGGEYAIENLNSKLLILDDGFQHIKLERARNICLIDCSDQYFGELFPIGSRREELTALQRADLFILTRSQQNEFLRNKYLDLLKKYAPNKPIYYLKEEIKKFTLGLSRIEEYPRGKRVLAFCGLGNPGQFFEMLKEKGLNICQTISFADHFDYKKSDLENLQIEAQNCEAEFLVTTSKDAVKIDQLAMPPNLIVAHHEILGLEGFEEDMSSQLSNLLGLDIFNNLIPNEAERVV